MTFTIGEENLPAILTAKPMTDDEFAELCAEHPDLFFEMSSEGELLIMPPSFSLMTYRHRAVLTQLDRWAQTDGRGDTGDASGGFVLSNGARRSPDVFWMLKARVRALDPKSRERYWHLCPDFVIEVRSATDRLRTLREKMLEWVENGARLAWLIDPETRCVEIFRPGQEPEVRCGISEIAGEDPVEGFVLNLVPVWDPLAA